MRILFISNFYPPHDRGGYEKHCQEIAHGLQRCGHSVWILTSRYGVEHTMRDGEVIRTLYTEANLDHYNLFDFFLHRRQQEKHNVQALIETIEETEPDLIVFWGMWNLSRNLPIIAENGTKPVAYWIGDLWPILPDMHTRYWHSLTENQTSSVVVKIVARIALGILRCQKYPPTPRFEYVACGSLFLKQQISKTIPAFDRARTVICGVDLNLFQGFAARQRIRDSDIPHIVYVGALSEQKGIHTLVEAIAVLAKLNQSIKPHLTIIGAGQPSYKRRLHQTVQSLGLSKQVTFVGAVPKGQIPALLEGQDILVAPSIVEEGFGRVLVEGMAAGLVVLSTATGAGGEIIQHEINGLVFPPGDADALASSLLRLVENPMIYARLARVGQKSSARFDIQRMIDGMEKFFLETIAIREQL
jgi:glycogen(starch) synthase